MTESRALTQTHTLAHTRRRADGANYVGFAVLLKSVSHGSADKVVASMVTVFQNFTQTAFAVI